MKLNNLHCVFQYLFVAFCTNLHCVGTCTIYRRFICLTFFWGGLQAINSLKNVESIALLQFLQPILNMLLHLIGDGGETLQVVTLLIMFPFCISTCAVLTELHFLPSVYLDDITH